MQHCQNSAEGMMFLKMSSTIKFIVCAEQMHVLAGNTMSSVKHKDNQQC